MRLDLKDPSPSFQMTTSKDPDSIDSGCALPFPDSKDCREKSTEYFIVRFKIGSYAEKCAGEIVERLEAVCNCASEWFEQTPKIEKFSVFLTDTLDEINSGEWLPIDSGYLHREANVVWLSVSPENPAKGLECVVLQFFSRTVSPAPSSDVVELLPSLSRLIHRTGPDFVAAEQYNYDTRERPAPHPFRRSSNQPPGFDETATASFLLFLENQYGNNLLRSFVRYVIAGGADGAAKLTYSKPLEVLRNEWLRTLRARSRNSAGSVYVIKGLLPLLKPYKPQIAKWFVFMIGEVLFNLSIPLSAKYLYDHVISKGDFAYLIWWSLIVTTIFIVGSLAMRARLVNSGVIGELVLRDLRRKLFAHLQRLPLSFHERAKSGALATRVINDTQIAQSVLGQCLPEAIFQTTSFITMIVALFFLDWRLGLVVILVALPVYSIVNYRVSKRFYQLGRHLQYRSGNATAFVQEDVASQTTVKAFSLEAEFEELFARQNSNLFKTGVKLNRLNATISGNNFMISLGMRVGLMGLGALLVMRNAMTVGDLIAFVALSAQSFVPIWSVSNQYQKITVASGAFDRIQEIFDEIPETAEYDRPKELLPLKQEIRFENVSFDYDGGEPELADINIAISAGSRIAVVGPSGSGKSTFVRLLLRFDDPTKGRVLFDGVDIREVDVDSLRKQLAVVSQEPQLFNMSIGRNIEFGCKGADQSEIVRAAHDACVDDMITALGGYATTIGERGLRLSGGQRQRLAIARAIIRDPSVLVFDEATSALDPVTESHVLETIHRVSDGRTLITVTHNLANVSNCDCIFVLSGGRLVEKGNHSELLDAGGLYKSMFSEQSRRESAWDSRITSSNESCDLRDVPLLAGLDKESLGVVSRLMRVERYRTGDYIFNQGDSAECLYFIAGGEVEITVNNRGVTQHINTLHKGDYFGEVSLLGNELRTASARAALPSRLYSLSKTDFMQLLDREPDIRQAINTVVRRRRQEIVLADASLDLSSSAQR